VTPRSVIWFHRNGAVRDDVRTNMNDRKLAVARRGGALAPVCCEEEAMQVVDPLCQFFLVCLNVAYTLSKFSMSMPMVGREMM
jgi:hypothetical protein